MPRKTSEDLYLKVGRIEGKMDGMDKNIKSLHSKLDDYIKAHQEKEATQDKDIEDLKSWKTHVMGLVAGVTLIFTAIGWALKYAWEYVTKS